MSLSEIIINPFSNVTFLQNNSQIIGLIIDVPIPNKSKKTFQILTEDNSELVDFIIDLTKWGFSQFDENDLTESEKELLLRNGFLVEKDSAPQKPLFACFVDEIEVDSSELPKFSDLMVNPSFRFEDFELSNSIHQIHHNNFSPYFSTVWIKNPVTEIEIGFWLRNEYLDFAKSFVAGEKPDFVIPEPVLQRFIQTEILVNSSSIKQKEKQLAKHLKNLQKIYAEKKYVVIEEILPSYYMRAMQIFFRQYVANGFMPFDDGQVKRRYFQHNLPLAQFFHQNLTVLMSKIVGLELKPSYVYAASYIEDAELDPHTDREQCEYSISFQVDYLPEPIDSISPWGLYLSPLNQEQLSNINPYGFTFDWKEYPEDNSTNQNVTKIHLKNGDGLVYKGRELVHYRYPLPKNHQSTSLFFHYVAKDYEGFLN